MSFSVLSFILPLVNISGWVPTNSGAIITYIDRVAVLTEHSSLPDSNTIATLVGQWHMFTIVLISGAVILLGRLLVQLLSLKRLTSKATLLQGGKVKIYHLPGQHLPFSFINSIYLNKDLHSEEELGNIIQHELVQ